MVKGIVMDIRLYNLAEGSKTPVDSPIVVQLKVNHPKHKEILRLVELSPRALIIDRGDIVWWVKGVLYWVSKDNPTQEPLPCSMVTRNRQGKNPT